MADQRRSETLTEAGVTVETYIDGAGPALVILPSYGRDGGEDFDDRDRGPVRLVRAGPRQRHLEPGRLRMAPARFAGGRPVKTPPAWEAP